MAKFRLKINKFFEIIKEKLLQKTTPTEWIMLIVVVALIFLKFVYMNNSTNKHKVEPVGDFGPTPLEKHINSKDKDLNKE